VSWFVCGIIARTKRAERTFAFCGESQFFAFPRKKPRLCKPVARTLHDILLTRRADDAQFCHSSNNIRSNNKHAHDPDKLNRIKNNPLEFIFSRSPCALRFLNPHVPNLPRRPECVQAPLLVTYTKNS